MKNSISKAILLAAPLSLSLTGCSSSTTPTPEPSKDGYYTEGREIDFVEGEKEEVATYHGTYINGTFPLTQTGQGYTGEVADPHIVDGENGYLYIFATNRIGLRSQDGCNWEIFSNNVINRPTWGDQYVKDHYGDKAATPGVWAPDVMKVKDKWIYYYSLSGWGSPVGIGYAVADNIEGPYEDKGKLFTCEEVGIENCIDAALFREGEDMYIICGSFRGIYLMELTSDGQSLYEDKYIEDKFAYAKENKVLVAGYAGNWDGSTYEGAYLTKKGEYYYLFGSAGTCCEGQNSTYSVFVGRSKNIEGPYVGKDGKAMTQSIKGNTYGELVLWSGAPGSERNAIAPGHNSIYVDNEGEWWIYYHAYVKADKYKTRHLLLDKINWDEDGFPFVGSVEDGNYKKPSYDVELEGPAIKE